MYEQQQQGNNPNRLSTDWFYSSMMLTDRLDIADQAGGSTTNSSSNEDTSSFDLCHLKALSHSSSATWNPEPLDSSDQHVQYCYAATSGTSYLSSSSALPNIAATAARTTSSSPSPPFSSVIAPNTSSELVEAARMPNTEEPLHDVNMQKNLSFDNSDVAFHKQETFCEASSANFKAGPKNDDTLHGDTSIVAAESCNELEQQQQQHLSTKMCSSSSSSSRNGCCRSSPGNGVVQESLEAPPSSALNSHSTTTNSADDQMKWDCAARWPSPARTGMMSTSSRAPLPVVSDGQEKYYYYATAGQRSGLETPCKFAADSQMQSNSSTLLLGGTTAVALFETNSMRESRSPGSSIFITKAKVQPQDKCNFVCVDTAVSDEAESVSCSHSSSPATQQQPSFSTTTCFESSSSLGSIKVPVRKRSLRHATSTAAVPYSISTITANANSLLPLDTVANVSVDQQLLPTMLTSATGTTGPAVSAFFGCNNLADNDTVSREKPSTSVASCKGTNHHENITSSHLLTQVNTAQTAPVKFENSLSQADIISLLCQNVYDIEHIVAQQQRVASGKLTAPPSPLTTSQQSRTGCYPTVLDPTTVPDSQSPLQLEKERPGPIDSEKHRFHPYATAAATTSPVTTAAVATTTTAIATTTAATTINANTTSASNSTGPRTVWLPPSSLSAAPAASRTDLKQKHLRSLAPVLYDLLSDDDCNSENCRCHHNPVQSVSNHSFLGSCCMEPAASSMDAYFRSLSLLAATASLPVIINNKFDQLPLNYIDYFALQQSNLLLSISPPSSASVTSQDLLSFAQSANLFCNSSTDKSVSDQAALFANVAPFTTELNQVFLFIFVAAFRLSSKILKFVFF